MSKKTKTSAKQFVRTVETPDFDATCVPGGSANADSGTYKELKAHFRSVAAVAKKLGTTQPKVKAALKTLGVTKVIGRSVGGYVDFSHPDYTVRLCYMAGPEAGNGR